MIQWMLGIWSLVPLPFLKPAWISRRSWFTYCWSLAWRILSITLLACEMSAVVWLFEHSLALPFFGIGMKTVLFQSCGHCWVFQICWHIECSTFRASSFRIWKRSTGIPSPPLALFLVMLRPTWLHIPGCQWNASLDETQAGIKVSWRNINNLWYEDDTILVAKSEEEPNGIGAMRMQWTLYAAHETARLEFHHLH